MIFFLGPIISPKKKHLNTSNDNDDLLKYYLRVETIIVPPWIN